jgi:hypothetical protein
MNNSPVTLDEIEFEHAASAHRRHIADCLKVGEMDPWCRSYEQMVVILKTIHPHVSDTNSIVDLYERHIHPLTMEEKQAVSNMKMRYHLAVDKKLWANPSYPYDIQAVDKVYSLNKIPEMIRESINRIRRDGMKTEEKILLELILYFDTSRACVTPVFHQMKAAGVLKTISRQIVQDWFNRLTCASS